MSYGEYDIKTDRDGRGFVAYTDMPDCMVTGRGALPTDALRDLADRLERWEDEHEADAVHEVLEARRNGVRPGMHFSATLGGAA